jgi:pimeloyl-ACP methyl ester carboxylesterase
MSSLGESYGATPTQFVIGANGVKYAYRELGSGEIPLILFQHFRGNLDNWDPALMDDLASTRHVLTFNNVGVGSTKGITPHTIERMAYDAIEFVVALGIEEADLLGYSIGSFVAQEVVLVRPDLVRRIILASSAPKGADGMHGWAPGVIQAVGQLGTNPDGYLSVFYTESAESKAAGGESLRRMFRRQEGRDTPVSWETRLAQYDAVCAWGVPNHSLLQRLQAVDVPVLVANGERDPMILTRYSYLLAGLIADAQLKIYPDSAHGFLFQHRTEFAADVHSFLAS